MVGKIQPQIEDPGEEGPETVPTATKLGGFHEKSVKEPALNLILLEGAMGAMIWELHVVRIYVDWIRELHPRYSQNKTSANQKSLNMNSSLGSTDIISRYQTLGCLQCFDRAIMIEPFRQAITPET